MAIQKVPVTLPDGSVSLVDMEMDALVHAVDQTGAYIGLVPEGTVGAHRTDSEPKGANWVWDFSTEAYVYVAPLSEERQTALLKIDFAAGACRSRFITDVTGQTETYAAKAKQAQEYKDAKYAGLAPPYVVGEAEATGLTFKAAATAILAAATTTNEVTFPLIEKERRIGKINVTKAEDVAGVRAALQEALTNLNLI